MLLAVVAVLVAVFFVATGRGGEMSREHVDYAPLELGSVSAADIAMVRPPTAMWGYNVDVTDEVLDQIARAVRDRDLDDRVPAGAACRAGGPGRPARRGRPGR